MRKFLLTSLGLVGFGTVMLPVAGHACDRDFQLINQTRFDIDSVWLSSYGDGEWHRVRNGHISSGNALDVSFDNNGSGYVQIRVEFTNGESTEFRRGFDLCQIQYLTMSYDGSTGQIDWNYR